MKRGVGMKSRYNLIVSNSEIIKEIQLPIDKDMIRIGTKYGADIRLHQEDFISEFEFILKAEEESWVITCLNNTFLSLGDAKKVVYLELSHGIEADLYSQESGRKLLHMEFSYNFDWEEKKYDSLIAMNQVQKIFIGTRPECEIFLLGSMDGNEFIELRNMGNYLEALIHSTRVGFYLNGKSVGQRCKIYDTDFFSVAQFSFYYRCQQIYVSNSSQIMVRNLKIQKCEENFNALQYPKFVRNPHYELVIPEQEIQILEPPAAPHKEESNLLLSLLPSVAMVVLTIVVKGFMDQSSSGIGYILFSICSMAIGIITSVLNYIKGKKKYAQKVEKREHMYREYIQGKVAEIEAARKEESILLNNAFPDEGKSIALVNNFSGDLFERTILNDKLLKIRLGQGTLPAKRKIVYKKKETVIPADELESIPSEIAQNYQKIENLPVICDLKKVGNLGVVGSEKLCYEFLKLLTLELCVYHHYDDIQLFYGFKKERSRQMGWIRMLPQVQKNHREVRNIICDEESQVTQFEYLYKELSYRRNQGDKLETPWIVVILLDECGFFNHPVSKFLKDACNYRVHFVFFSEYREKLSMYCGEVISLDEHQTGILEQAGNEEKIRFYFHNISEEYMYRISQKLAPIQGEDINLEGALTKNITLFELLNIYSVDDLQLDRLWKQKDIVKTMQAPLGVKNKNELVYLDLHEKAHGPHGLVAGTTGSGKSELLQTYILSMALQYSPFEVGFVLIDFKGGGMANQFRNLPHLIGAITDIDGKEINRSLLSIRAELSRRKELFAEANVNSIGQYITKYRNSQVTIPLPHLIIIVDEFAELKAEQPEFMKELISASRIGRSLGVHLILATQKPAGQVSDQIWSNSKFKICLKVQSQSDSNEVIKSPLAAEIKEPGRAYLQVGNNELFELIQSAYSGGPEKYDIGKKKQKKFCIYDMDLAGRKEILYQQKQEEVVEKSRSQLQAVVDKIASYCQENKIKKLPDICLAPLPEVLDFPTNIMAETEVKEIKAEIGIYDAPESQYQGMASLNISGKNTVIIGSSQYGKTNLLQSIIRMLATKYTPDDVNIYMLDFGSMFLKNYEKLPHVGGVVCATEEEKFRNLFKLLNQEIALRKDKLVAFGVSSFMAYREAGYCDLPYIVVLVDNFTAVKELYFSDEDNLIYICREGIAVGINVIITNPQTAGFGYKYFSTISNQIALYCNEGDEINSLFGYCKERPDNRPGSCLFQIDKKVYHAQTWLAFEGEKEIERSNAIRSFVEKQILRCNGKKAKQIPQVPEELTMQEVYELNTEVNPNDTFAIGIDYEEIETVTLNFKEQFMLGLLGDNEETKQQFVENLILDIREHIFERELKLYIVDSVNKALKKYLDLPFVEKYTTQADEFLDIVDDLESILQERQEMYEEEGANALKNMPLLMIIVNTKKAVDLCGNSRESMKKFDNISKNYRNLKVMFLFADIENTSNIHSAGDLMKRIRDEKKVVLFSSLKNSKLIEFSLQVIRQKNQILRKNDAFFVDKEEVKRIKMVDNNH